MPATWEQLAARQDSEKIYTVEIDTVRPDTTVETLYLSTHGIDPDLTPRPYLPLLGEDIPEFSRSMQEVFSGRTQIGYGELAITNPREREGQPGRLDRLVDENQWAGQPIRYKLGFGGLPVADYRAIFTGRVDRMTYGDEGIRAPIVDHQAGLTRKRQSGGNYTGQLPDMVTALLSIGGITDIDQTAWDNWAAANGFSVFYNLEAATSVGTVLDDLLSPLACWWGFSRAGLFQIGTFLPPDAGDPDLSINLDTHGIGPISLTERDRYWKVRVSYNPQSKQTTSREDSAILSADPLAMEGGEKATALALTADAVTVRDRWWDLLSPQRHEMTVTTKVAPMAITIHDQIQIVEERWGIDDNFRAIGVTENHSENAASLRLIR